MTGDAAPAARWKPNRAGIRNIWEYDEQVFAFADGRMILRGPNGSGKSNALALIFPFLFDGTMSAAAMDPFAGGRSMKSLLLGVLRDDARSGFRHDQRLGYVWLELTRPGPDGDEHRTVGCGARARADGDARSWFFVTDRRVGVDLDLAPDDTPLTRGRLIEELGADAVHDRAEEHRQVVARDLLGIDADQLGKLNGLIRALRRPQLAGKLNLDELSAVLSSGLPAVAPTTLDDIAASLDDLERVQHELAAVREALATVDAFLPTYRTYLGGEARLRAGVVLDRDRRLAAEQRDLDRHEQHQRRLLDRDRELRDRRTNAEAGRAEAVAERDALKDSERYKGAEQLTREEAYASTLDAAAVSAGTRRDDADQRAAQLDARAAETEQEATTASAEADRELRDTMDRADAVRAVWSLDPDAHHDPVQLRSAVDVMVGERRQAIAAVRAAIRAFEVAEQAYRSAEEARSAADRVADGAAEQVRRSADEQDRQRVVLGEQVATWLASVPGLDEPSRADLAGLVDRAAEGESVALGERYRLASEAYRDGRRDARHAVETAIDEHQRRGEELRREREEVAAEVDPGPTPPPWRTADRTDRPGAPLWACCDFADDGGLGAADQAGLEAALDAAGLLDAWVSPDGQVGDTDDSWLRAVDRHPDPAEDSRGGRVDGDGDGDDPGTAGDPGDGGDPGSGSDGRAATLASVLAAVVPDGSGLSEATILAVLGAVELGPIGISVSADGRFSLGPLAGRATKPAAEFIGATARAERRARRLAELDALLAALDVEQERLRSERERIDAELAGWDDAARRAPDSRPLVEAAGRRRADEIRERDARQRAEDAAEAEANAAATVSRAGTERDAVAARQAVPVAHDELDRFGRAVDQLADHGRDAARLRDRAVELRTRAGQQRGDAEEAGATAGQRRAEADTAEREAGAQRRRVDTLRRRLGDDVGAVFDEVAALDARIVELDQTVRTTGSAIEANQSDLGEANGAIVAARVRIGEAEAQGLGSQRRLAVLRGREVLTLLDLSSVGSEPDLPLEPVAFARWIADRLGSAPEGPAHDQAKRAVDRAQKQLLDDLHQGYAPAIVHDDDVILVEVTSDDRSVFGLAELRDRLEHQVAAMEQHLTDSDREIFERHLLNRVSHELRRLLGEADEFVHGVNEALARTRTASGLRVELQWVPTGDDPETRRALELLRRDTDQMGDDDRAALRRFFDLAIKRQRAEDPDAGYRGNLEQVVDYRQWHRFQPHLVGPDGRARLTRERFRGLSGGEQAVALHLPLFAAAAAHYDRCDASAPRLVALDEAFAGIDEAMRGELLGLTVAFDLDVLLTGHELWGAYAEVPAIAVHDLLRRPPLEGVSVLTLRWDGHDLHEDAGEPARSASPPAAMPDDGLFAQPPDPT